jgi:hypothetical protein
MAVVAFVPYPGLADVPALDRITRALDPVLTPLGFAPGQAGAAEGRGQVIFCRGPVEGGDGDCVDLVVDVAMMPEWRVTDVRYWGYPSDRWYLRFEAEGDLDSQLTGLARTLPVDLS